LNVLKYFEDILLQSKSHNYWHNVITINSGCHIDGEMTYTICQFFKVHVDLPIEWSFLIPLIKCWESLVCLIAKNSGHIQCVMAKTWKVTLLIDTPYKGRSTWKVTYLDKFWVTFVAWTMVLAQGCTHKNCCSLLQLTFMYKKVFYLSGGVFACDKQDWAEEDFSCVV
jgi:hypothetical protein